MTLKKKKNPEIRRIKQEGERFNNPLYRVCLEKSFDPSAELKSNVVISRTSRTSFELTVSCPYTMSSLADGFELDSEQGT